MLTTLPDTPERPQQELDLQIALGAALMATKGYAAPEVEQAYTRARALCQQVGRRPSSSTVLWDCGFIARAELQTAHELGEQLLSLAQQRTTTPRSSCRLTMRLGYLVLSGRVRLGPRPTSSRACPL